MTDHKDASEMHWIVGGLVGVHRRVLYPYLVVGTVILRETLHRGRKMDDLEENLDSGLLWLPSKDAKFRWRHVERR